MIDPRAEPPIRLGPKIRIELVSIKGIAPVAGPVAFNATGSTSFVELPGNATEIVGIALEGPGGVYALEAHFDGEPAGSQLFNYAHAGNSVVHPLSLDVRNIAARRPVLELSGEARASGVYTITLLVRTESAR